MVLDLPLRPHGDLLLLLLLVHHQKLHEVSVSRYSEYQENFIKFLAIVFKAETNTEINKCKFYNSRVCTFNASSGDSSSS